MATRYFSASALSAALAFAISLPAIATPQDAQTAVNDSAATLTTPAGSKPAPSYDSDQIGGGPLTGNFNTPEADGRPGEYYFLLGARAYRHGDYAHAIAMWKVAAAWAWKPAEYDLALMYFNGNGVPADRPRGAAWMVLAAERNDSSYAHARDLMITSLSEAEFAQTNAIWQELKPRYGDEVAMHRAKIRWAQVKSDMTGSRVGDGAEYLMVGSGDGANGPLDQISIMPGADPHHVAVAGWGVFHGGEFTDGSIAYSQFHASDNPYDPRFLKGWTGTATVGPLTPINAGNAAQKQPDNNDRNL